MVEDSVATEQEVTVQLRVRYRAVHATEPGWAWNPAHTQKERWIAGDWRIYAPSGAGGEEQILVVVDDATFQEQYEIVEGEAPAAAPQGEPAIRF